MDQHVVMACNVVRGTAERRQAVRATIGEAPRYVTALAGSLSGATREGFLEEVNPVKV